MMLLLRGVEGVVSGGARPSESWVESPPDTIVNVTHNIAPVRLWRRAAVRMLWSMTGCRGWSAGTAWAAPARGLR